jgi:hypothetical protein
MITRQNDILKEWNLYLVDYKFHTRALAQTDKVEAIRKARLSLNQWGFTLWFQEWEQSSSYEVEEMEHNGAFAHYVHRVGTSGESSRVIVTQGEPCDCSSKFSYGIQCRHDLAINPVFDSGKFKDPEADFVEVVCLAEGGIPIPGCYFLHVGQAIAWMRKNASKTRRVFSKLKDPKQDNPYKRRYRDL